MVELWTSKIGGNVTELSTQGTTTGTGTWLSVTSMRDSTHVYNNGQAAPVHQHSGYSPLHAHGICLTAHTHPGKSTRPKSKHTKSYCQPLTLLQSHKFRVHFNYDWELGLIKGGWAEADLLSLCATTLI